MPKNCSEKCPHNGANFDAKWTQHGGKKASTHQCFFDGFPNASGNIELFAGKPRVSREWAAADARVSHFLQPTPQGGAILSKNIVQKQTKTA